jgi:broad specificity phosphatase PhoE
MVRDMPATLVYLIRHAETVWNVERRIQGSLDAPLTDRGRRQVACLVAALREVPLAALYASPLERALQTARPLAAARGLPVHPVEDLREIDQGEWESRRLDEVRAEDGERLLAWWSAPHTVRMPGGETLEEVQARARRAFDAIAGRHAGERVAAVAHGGVNKALLLGLIGAPLAAYWRIRQNNACINIVEVDGAACRVLALNDTLHLGADAWHPPA